jgi:hypothetical protein
LAANLSFLKNHPEYLGSTSPVRFSGVDREFDARKMGDASLDDDDPNERIIKPFSTWHANGHFYGLFRRAAVLDWAPIGYMDFLGADWTLITHLASKGKLHRHTQGWVELGTEGMSHSGDIFAMYRKRRLHWVLPFVTVTVYAFAHLKNPRLTQRLTLFARLMRLNRKAARSQFRLWRKSKRQRS